MSNAATLAAQAVKWRAAGERTSLEALEGIHAAIVQQDTERAFGLISDAAIERACKAHWPTWDRMRPDHQRKWRDKMRAALIAFTG